jgi:hypothetical protein
LAEAVRAALLQARDKQPVLFQIVFDDGTMTQITVVPLVAPAANSAASAPSVGATDTEQGILRVLQAADKPVKKATIASRANLVFNSYFKQAVSNLVKKGTVLSVEKCWYWLASRPLPPDLPGPTR